MKKTVLIVGGSKWQLDIISKVKSHGYFAAVTDISDQAPGKEIADIFYNVDSTDKDALLKIARAHNIAFAIAEQTDRVVPSVAYLNEQLNLRGITPQIAQRFTDKFIMRTILAETRLKQPEFCLVANLTEAILAAEKMTYPVVLKPRSSQSSFGVFKVENEADLRMRFIESFAFSKDGTLLLEQYIPGTEITVEGFCVNYKCFPLAMSEKEHYPQNDCVSRKLIYPPSFSESVLDLVRKYVIEVVEKLGLELGIFHAELKIDGDDVLLIEVAARGGGHKIASVIVPHVSGIDVYDLLIEALAGKEVGIYSIENKGAVLGFFDFEPGRIKQINGVEKIINDARVHEIRLNFTKGDTIAKAKDDVTRAGYYIALCNNGDETRILDKEILSTVSVDYFI